MTPNCVKLGRAVTFVKHLASIVFLICLPKALMWNEITLALSNSLNLAELVVKSLLNKVPRVPKCLSALSALSA